MVRFTGGGGLGPAVGPSRAEDLAGVHRQVEAVDAVTPGYTLVTPRADHQGGTPPPAGRGAPTPGEGRQPSAPPPGAETASAASGSTHRSRYRRRAAALRGPRPSPARAPGPRSLSPWRTPLRRGPRIRFAYLEAGRRRSAALCPARLPRPRPTWEGRWAARPRRVSTPSRPSFRLRAERRRSRRQLPGRPGARRHRRCRRPGPRGDACSWPRLGAIDAYTAAGYRPERFRNW